MLVDGTGVPAEVELGEARRRGGRRFARRREERRRSLNWGLLELFAGLRPKRGACTWQASRAARTAILTPVANAYAERFVRTIRHECLDWILIRSKRYLVHIASEYVERYNRDASTRLGPQPPDPPQRLLAGPIERHDRLGGLIHHYERSAA